MKLSAYLLIFYLMVACVSSEPPEFGLDNVWISKIFADTMWKWAANSTLNTECTRQSRIYLDHLDNNTHWAIRSKFYILFVLSNPKTFLDTIIILPKWPKSFRY